MKKILCLILALTCVFGLVSCDGDAKDFIEIVNSSSPTKIITLTSYNTKEHNFTGRYETTIDGFNSTLVYEYERFATVDEAVADGTDEYIKTVSGTVYYKDGRYSEDNETWVSEVPDAVFQTIKLDLSSKNLGDYEISEDGKTLTATTTAEKAEKMFGTVISTDGDVTVTIQHDGHLLRKIIIAYTTENAEAVEVITSYSYAVAEEGPEETEQPSDETDESNEE